MLVALEEAATAIAGKNDETVLFLDRKGKQVMTLRKIGAPEEQTPSPSVKRPRRGPSVYSPMRERMGRFCFGPECAS